MHSGPVHPTNGTPEIRLTHSQSPLTSLARRTSTKNRPNQQKPLIWEPYRPPSNHRAEQHLEHNAAATSTTRHNLRLTIEQSRPPIASSTLHSPLLHSHFPNRDSVLSGTSGYDDDDSQNDTLPYDGIDEHSHFSPAYLQTSSSHRSNGRAFNVAGEAASIPADDGSALKRPIANRASDIRNSDFLDYYLDREDIPAVIVSSPDTSVLNGRAPVIKPVLANFSRPMRDSGQWRQADAIAERVTPQLPPQMMDQKRAVLERNATRQTPKATAFVTAATSGYKHSPLSKEMTTSGSGQKALAINSAVGVAVAQPAMVRSIPYISPTPQPIDSTLHPPPTPEMRPHSPVSPSSPYSTYSYYQYDGLIPSPVLPGSSNLNRGTTPSIRVDAAPSDQRPQTAQDFLLLGIEHHEANRLQESTRCFERSAKEGGGCGVGMLMYGLSLRHGWGCLKNEALGFKWVRKAAESAVGDLEQLRAGKANIDKGSIQAELVLAIYEVGQCFFHGWGVAKDQKMGFSYYMVAAQLGDSDAQGDLAFCLSNGKGCKKNKKEAARWYRAAVQQGQSDVGLAWIYKDKYRD